MKKPNWKNREKVKLEKEVRAKGVDIENMKTEIANLTNICNLLSDKMSSKNGCQSAIFPSSPQETCAVEVKLDAVITDVDTLKELTSLLKLQNEVSMRTFITIPLHN